jgi:hypothetical protein
MLTAKNLTAKNLTAKNLTAKNLTAKNLTGQKSHRPKISPGKIELLTSQPRLAPSKLARSNSDRTPASPKRC